MKGIRAAFEAIKRKQQDRRKDGQIPILEEFDERPRSTYHGIEVTDQSGAEVSNYTAKLSNHPYVNKVQHSSWSSEISPDGKEGESFSIELKRPSEQKKPLVLSPSVSQVLQAKGYHLGPIRGAKITKLTRELDRPIRRGNNEIYTTSTGKGRYVGIFKGKTPVGAIAVRLKGPQTIAHVTLNEERHIEPVASAIFERPRSRRK